MTRSNAGLFALPRLAALVVAVAAALPTAALADVKIGVLMPLSGKGSA